jgi:Glycosyl hydrolase family 12
MRSASALAVSTVVLLLLLAGAPVAWAVAWSSSHRFAEWSNGGYLVRNNVWAKDGFGPQTISADSFSSWWVDSTQPNTNGVKSYPHVARKIDRGLSTLRSLTSSFTVSLPRDGTFNAAYDIWADNNSYEAMLWEYKQVATPIGVKQTTVRAGGSTWDVYKGNNGHRVYSFVRQGDITSATQLDVLAELNWLKDNKWWGDVTIGEVGFGFEISSTVGERETFMTRGYSVNFS